MKKFTPLLLEEIASNGGFTHMVVFTADDLTEATANTAQTIALPKVPKGFVINKGYARLVTPFEDKSDAAFNTTPFILGDAGDDDRYIASSELNKNGTEITYPTFNNTAFQVTADTELLAKFGSMAAKSLSNIDKGELHLVLQIIDTRILSDLQSAASIVK
jgi:hypothetical protein